MAESTLTLTVDDLRTEAALAFGYNPTYASCTTAQKSEIDRAVKAGTRQFYWPPAAPDPDIPGRLVTHRWMFMRVIEATLSLTSDDYDYDLPDAFAHVVGHEMTIQDDGEQYPTILIVGEVEIRRLRQADHDTTAVPKYVAIRPKAFTGASAGQRFEAIFWPIPDSSKTVSYTYAPLADAMVTSTYPYPWGGAAHAETLKASVRAEVEKIRFRERGVEYQAFLDRLSASIKVDRANAPRIVGKNLDRSDEEGLPEDVTLTARRFVAQGSIDWV